MEQYNVGGMSCAACSARVEKAVSQLDGVTSCSVSLLTNSMGVEGSAKPQEIIAAVENAGYTASVKGKDKQTEAKADSLKDTESPKILKRLIASLGFLLVLMYFSMGHSMLGLPLPEFFSGNHVALGLVQLLLAATVMIINQYGYARRARLGHGVCIQHSRAVFDDGGGNERQQRSGSRADARVLL